MEALLERPEELTGEAIGLEKVFVELLPEDIVVEMEGTDVHIEIDERTSYEGTIDHIDAGSSLPFLNVKPKENQPAAIDSSRIQLINVGRQRVSQIFYELVDPSFA